MAPAYPSINDDMETPHKINYAETHDPNAEEKVTRWSLCQLFCNYFVMILTIVIFSLGIIVFKQDNF